MKRKVLVILTILCLGSIGIWTTRWLIARFNPWKSISFDPATKTYSVPFTFGASDFLKRMEERLSNKAIAKEDLTNELYLQADKYFFQGKFDDAIKLWREVIQKYPDSECALWSYTGVLMSWYYKGEGSIDPEKAKEYYQEAINVGKEIIEKYPDSEEALHTYGAIGAVYATDLEDYKSAVEWGEKALEKYLQKGTREYIAHGMLCLSGTYYLTGEFNKAITVSQKLIDEYSDTDWVKNWEGMIYFNRGAVYGDLGEFDKAIEYLKLALEKLPSVPGIDNIKGNICLCIGDAYQEKKDIENARIWYQKVIDEYPDSEYVNEAKKELEDLKGNKK